MSIRSRFASIGLILNQDLSPQPLLTVILGYWLPLEWMIRGWAGMANTTLLEKFQAIGSSVLLNFLPAAFGLALLVYLCGAFVVLTRARYAPTVRWGMNFVANFIALAATALAIKLLLTGQQTAPTLVKLFALIVVTGLAIWLTVRRHFLSFHMVLPRWLSIAAVPLAVSLVSQEVLSQSKPVPSSFTTSGRTESQVFPDIVLITMDASSAKHLSGYGYSRCTSPNLDALSKNSVLFEGFYANANWTRPGIASLLNGARPWTHAGDLGRPRQEVTKDQNLLGCLSRAGYDIRTVSSNGMADHAWQRTPIVPAEQSLLIVGSFKGVLTPFFPSRPFSSMFSDHLGPAAWISRFLSTPPARDKASHPLALAKKMLERTPTGRPRFFWVHFNQPHDPYAAPDPCLGKFESSILFRDSVSSKADYLFSAQRYPDRQRILEGRYDEALLSIDSAIGDLMAWLKIQGRFDNSLVVVCADHGESFAHGYGGHGGPLLTEDLIRIPLIIKQPGQKAGERVSQLYEQADFAPTILRMVGIEIPQGMEGQAYPLKPGNAPIFAMNRDLSSSTPTFSVAMRLGNWKYVTHFGKWMHHWPRRELYDLGLDPNENSNLVALRKDIADPMHQRILEELTKRGLKPEAP